MIFKSEILKQTFKNVWNAF